MELHQIKQGFIFRTMRPRILFVAGVGSIHVVRWLAQLYGTGWDIHIVDPGNTLIHPELSHVTLHTGWRKVNKAQNLVIKYRWPFLRGRYFLEERFPKIWSRIVPDAPNRILQAIDKLKPDCIHSLAMQFSAYPVVEALKLNGGPLGIPWIYSAWGSDIFRYGYEPDHTERVKAVLSSCDYMMADCERDWHLARNFGFQGRWLGRFPTGGGFPIKRWQHNRIGQPSERKIIAIKGYQNKAGRALTALEAISQIVEQLKGYQIVVYSSQPVVDKAVDHLATQLPISIKVMPHSPQTEVIKMLGQARVSIGVSFSDGTPNAMLESMILGAFPIQTNPGGATAEWIEDGKNGLLIPYDDPNQISQAILRAVKDDELVNTAAFINYGLMSDRVDESIVRTQVVAAYQKVFSQSRLNSIPKVGHS